MGNVQEIGGIYGKIIRGIRRNFEVSLAYERDLEYESRNESDTYEPDNNVNDLEGKSGEG